MIISVNKHANTIISHKATSKFDTVFTKGMISDRYDDTVYVICEHTGKSFIIFTKVIIDCRTDEADSPIYRFYFYVFNSNSQSAIHREMRWTDDITLKEAIEATIASLQTKEYVPGANNNSLVYEDIAREYLSVHMKGLCKDMMRKYECRQQ